MEQNICVFKKYSDKSYRLCKGGIRVNDLVTTRCKDFAIMRLVDSMKRMMPYFISEYGLV